MFESHVEQEHFIICLQLQLHTVTTCCWQKEIKETNWPLSLWHESPFVFGRVGFGEWFILLCLHMGHCPGAHARVYENNPPMFTWKLIMLLEKKKKLALPKLGAKSRESDLLQKKELIAVERFSINVLGGRDASVPWLECEPVSKQLLRPLAEVTQTRAEQRT